MGVCGFLKDGGVDALGPEDPIELIEPGRVAEWIGVYPNIWQLRLLDIPSFSSFLSDRGVRFSQWHSLKKLWRCGLLKADVVRSRRKLLYKDLSPVGHDQLGCHLYADLRVPRERPRGWVGVFGTTPDVPGYVEPLFHPFRYFVVYHLDRLLDPRISASQKLWSEKGFHSLVERDIRRFRKFSGSPEFCERIRRWNSIVDLVVAAEPKWFPRVFGFGRYPRTFDAPDPRSQVVEQWGHVERVFRSLGLDRLENVRDRLTVDAEQLDHNKMVHTILRLTPRDDRLKIRGHLGGAIYILVMAEMLRRACESIFDTQLPEEGELGFGHTFPDAKLNLYGSNRILDGDRKIAQQYMRAKGLDFGVKLRWYVEGDTEYGALDYVFGDHREIELKNLHGRIAEKKMLAFVEGLGQDTKSSVASFIYLDSDNTDYLRAVKNAAAEDQFVGMFFVSEPDFEFHNFSLGELEEIIWDWASSSGCAEEKDRRQLHEVVESVSPTPSGKILWNTIHREMPELRRLGKGLEWGRVLMEYALRHPEKAGTDGGTKTRTIIEAVRAGDWAPTVSFHRNRARFRTDPETGKQVPREG